MLSDDEITDMWVSASSTEADEMDLYAFARAVERAAYEAAIKACESLENRVINTHPARIEFDPNSFMARKCADAIRALGEQHD